MEGAPACASYTNASWSMIVVALESMITAASTVG